MKFWGFKWLVKPIVLFVLPVFCLSAVYAEEIDWPVSRKLESGKYIVEKSEPIGIEGETLTYLSPVQLEPKGGGDAVPGELLSFWKVEFDDDGKTPKMAYIEAVEVHFPEGYKKQANELMQAVIDNIPVTTLDLRKDVEHAQESESSKNPGSKRSGYNTEPTEYKYDYNREESVKRAEESGQLKGKGGLLITPGGKGRGFWN